MSTLFQLLGMLFAVSQETMIRRVLLVALAAGVVGLQPSAADACTCAGPRSACEATGGADAIFIGHVVSIDVSPMNWRPMAGRVVQLAVIDAFRGLQLTQVSLVTGYGSTDCGYPFRMGESYLVYAHRSSTGELSTSICARTRPLSAAAEDLAYLRSLAAIKPGTPARVTGRVHLVEWSRPRGAKPRAMPGVTITAIGEGRTVTARSDRDGAFELAGLPLGSYKVTVKAPEGYEGGSQTVDIHDPRGCGPELLYVRYDGRVAGRAIDSGGNGVRGLPLELVATAGPDNSGGGAPPLRTWTAGNGTFEVRLVPPGRYLLTLPRAFNLGHPNSAGAEVVVSAGARVRLPDFVLPEGIPIVTVEGVVVDPAGQPARDAHIVLSDSSEGPSAVGPRFTTGPDGKFAFTVIDGRKYELHASRYVGPDSQTREAQIGMVRFTASETTSSLTVALRPSSP